MANLDNEFTSGGSDDTFNKAFGPLAHHFFPDGCPVEEVESVWPVRTNRSAIPPAQAVAAVSELSAYTFKYGLTTPQLSALALVAYETLPKRILAGGSTPKTGVGAGSPLVDGTSRHFRSLLQCMIPDAEAKIDSVVCSRLLSVACDREGKSSVLRLLHLCLKNPRVWETATRQRLEGPVLYSRIFALSLSEATNNDAIRVLIQLTRKIHARPDRAARLRAFYDQRPKRNAHSAVPSLLRLYAQLNPSGCDRFQDGLFPTHEWSLFHDTVWEQKFQRVVTDNTLVERPRKRNRADCSGCVDRAIQVLKLALETTERHEDYGDVSNATLLLSNTVGMHLMLLGHDAATNRFSNLPTILFQEWYSMPNLPIGHENAGKEMVRSRQSLVLMLAKFITCTHSWSAELESFVVEHVLPTWDGNDAMGWPLCYDILPHTSPCRFSRLRSRVLKHVETLFLFGSPRMQYIIVSGLLAGLLRKWAGADWSAVEQEQTKAGPSSKTAHIRTLKELIQWTDDLILKGFLEDGKSEILRSAAIEFFHVVCEKSAHGSFLATPSASLTYRLLLGRSVISVDRVCDVLVRYKAILQRLKTERLKLKEIPTDGADDLDRVKVFNCFLYDFCTVLWRAALASNKGTSILFTDLRSEIQTGLHTHAASVSKALSVTHGAIFASYAAAHTNQNSVALDTMYGGAKVTYLEYLRSEGLHGIHRFLTTYIKSLASVAPEPASMPT